MVGEHGYLSAAKRHRALTPPLEAGLIGLALPWAKDQSNNKPALSTVIGTAPVAVSRIAVRHSIQSGLVQGRSYHRLKDEFWHPSTSGRFRKSAVQVGCEMIGKMGDGSRRVFGFCSWKTSSIL